MEDTVYVQSEVAKVPDNVFGTAQGAQDAQQVGLTVTFVRLTPNQLCALTLKIWSELFEILDLLLSQLLRVRVEVPQTIPGTPVVPERKTHAVNCDFRSFPNEGHGDRA